MRAISSLVVLFLILVVAATTFAEDRKSNAENGSFSFSVEIDYVTAGIANLKSLTSKELQCPSANRQGSVVIYDQFEQWPSKVQLDGLKASKTHVLSRGRQQLTLTGVSSPKISKEKKTITFNYQACR